MTDSPPEPGSADLLAYPLQRECPYRPAAGMARFREAGPITRVRLYDGRTSWFVTGPEELRTILADPQMSCHSTFPDYPVIDEGLLHMRATREMEREGIEGGFPAALFGVDPPEHTRQRKMLLPAFTTRKVAGYRQKIQQIVDQRLEALISEGKGADLVSVFAAPIPLMVVCMFLGVPYEEHDVFQGPMLDLLVPERADDALEKFSEYLVQLIDAKIVSPGDGLLDQLIVDHVRTGALDPQELVAFAQAILVAGTLTTTNAIALGTYALLDHGQYGLLVKDPSLIPGAIEEILRYINLVEVLIRVATKDIEVGGQVIKAGDGILLSCAAANLDPSVTSHPERLDITRPPITQLAFSYGLHHCMGKNLARLELDIAFRALTQRLPELRRAVPADQVRWQFDFTLPRLLWFPVTW